MDSQSPTAVGLASCCLLQFFFLSTPVRKPNSLKLRIHPEFIDEWD